ncbi:MAG: transporter substrate-binding domain-containing protein [Alphaproteobacteria bacterium]|nr:transporter substrate-binding domain-containing protein [Alphaproteobacteria bacterium]
MLTGLLTAAAVMGWVGELAAKPLQVATEGEYPPFSFVDDQGRLVGFDVDIAQALCREMHTTCEVVKVAWTDLLDGLAAGRYDMVVASMARTPAREEKATFTDYYYKARGLFVGHANTRIALTPAGLEGKTIACQQGTVQEDFLRTHRKGVTVLSMETVEDAMEAVLAGKADLILTDTLSAYDFLKGERGSTLDVVGDPLSDQEMSAPAHIQVRKGDTALRDRVDQALQRIRLDGSYHRINQKYFPFSIY